MGRSCVLTFGSVDDVRRFVQSCETLAGLVVGLQAEVHSTVLVELVHQTQRQRFSSVVERVAEAGVHLSLTASNLDLIRAFGRAVEALGQDEPLSIGAETSPKLKSPTLTPLTVSVQVPTPLGHAPAESSQPKTSLTPVPVPPATVTPRQSLPVPSWDPFQRSSLSRGGIRYLEERVNQLGLPIDLWRINELERARAVLPEVLPVAWLLAVSWSETADREVLRMILSAVCEVVTSYGGMLDDLKAKSATFVFSGLGSQAGCALAGLELQERFEALADGRLNSTIACALIGGRLRAQPGEPLSGDAVSALDQLLARAAPGQCLLPRNVSHGVSDLVVSRPAGDVMELVGRQAPFQKPLPTLGLEPTLSAFSRRLDGFSARLQAPLAMVGPPRSGRTQLAHELARTAQRAGVFVGFTSSLEGVGPHAAMAELICQVFGVPYGDRHQLLRPALHRAGLSPSRVEAVYASLGLSAPPGAFSPSQVAGTLRAALAALSKSQGYVLILDGLDQADAQSTEVVYELVKAPVRGEWLVLLTTADQARSLGVELAQPIPTLSAAEVDELLTQALGSAPIDLRAALTAHAGWYPGQVMDSLLGTLARGAVRPKGQALVLEGSVPDFSERVAVQSLLTAGGTRARRVLEAVWSLGEHAHTSSVGRVLPTVAHEVWPRVTVSRFLLGLGDKLRVAGSVEGLIRESRSDGPGLAARCADELLATASPSGAGLERVALLWERAEDWHRAQAQWKAVGEEALRSGNGQRAASALEGMARVLRHHQRPKDHDVIVSRLELWARAACLRLSLRDFERAHAALAEALKDSPDGLSSVEVGYAQAKVACAEERWSEGQQFVSLTSRGLAASPIRAAVFALHAECLEAERDFGGALRQWQLALNHADVFEPLAPWFGERDFRARVEQRVGLRAAVLGQTAVAKSSLWSAAQRFQAAGAHLHAAAAVADLAAISSKAGEKGEYLGLIRTAATLAGQGGNFTLQAAHLRLIAQTLRMEGDPRAEEVEREAANALAEW